MGPFAHLVVAGGPYPWTSSQKPLFSPFFLNVCASIGLETADLEGNETALVGTCSEGDACEELYDMDVLQNQVRRVPTRANLSLPICKCIPAGPSGVRGSTAPL